MQIILLENLLKPLRDGFEIAARARAMENQCFVAAANCCGRQGKLDFFGMSLIIAPRGELLAEADDFATELVATCDFRELADYRAQITCFADRRPDVYGILP